MISSVDAFARTIAVIGAVVGVLDLVPSGLALWRSRHRVIVQLRSWTSHTTGNPISIVQVAVTTIGRPITIEDISIEWDDLRPRPRPRSFKLTRLSAEDFGFLPSVVDENLDMAWRLGIRNQVVPNRLMRLEDGTTEVFSLGAITTDDPLWSFDADVHPAPAQIESSGLRAWSKAALP
jgi:hypothetical protein